MPARTEQYKVIYRVLKNDPKNQMKFNLVNRCDNVRGKINPQKQQVPHKKKAIVWKES